MADRAKRLGLHFVVGICAIALGVKLQSASALELGAREASEQIVVSKRVDHKRVDHKHVANANAPVSAEGFVSAKPTSTAARKPRVRTSEKGPYYVDFRARTGVRIYQAVAGEFAALER
jgi:hypothetical protein